MRVREGVTVERNHRRPPAAVQRQVASGGAAHAPAHTLLRGGALGPLDRLRPTDVLALQRSAGNAAVTNAIQRQPTKEEKEAKKAEAKDSAEQAAQKAIDAAKEEAPEQAADKVKDAVQEKLTDPALARMKKGGADPDKVADAEAAAEQLKDVAGTAAESITKSVLSGDKVGPSLAAALQKKLSPKPTGPLALPTLELDSCSIGVGKPKPTSPVSIFKDPSKVGVSWKVLDGKCTFSSGESLNFSTTFSTKGFLTKDFELRPPTSFSAEAGIEFKGRGFTIGGTYKLNKDPEATGHTAGVKAAIYF